MLDNPEFKALPTQINHVLGLLKFLESASNASLDPLRAEIQQLTQRATEVIKPGWRMLQMLPMIRQGPLDENYAAFSKMLSEFAHDLSRLAIKLDPTSEPLPIRSAKTGTIDQSIEDAYGRAQGK
jgi:hypothetical protein